MQAVGIRGSAVYVLIPYNLKYYIMLNCIRKNNLWHFTNALNCIIQVIRTTTNKATIRHILMYECGLNILLLNCTNRNCVKVNESTSLKYIFLIHFLKILLITIFLFIYIIVHFQFLSYFSLCYNFRGAHFLCTNFFLFFWLYFNIIIFWWSQWLAEQTFKVFT